MERIVSPVPFHITAMRFLFAGIVMVLAVVAGGKLLTPAIGAEKQ